MKIKLSFDASQYEADLSKPLDLSINVGDVRCFYAPKVTMEPYRAGDFIGSVKNGAPVNFYDVKFNPHGNGTHTESLGHITKKQESVNKALKQYHHFAQLVTVSLTKRGKKDSVITVSELKRSCPKKLPKALIIRTKPNFKSKQTKDYSGTNPPYLDKRAMKFIVDQGVEHLLIDLPSVDREVDKGILASHHIFWKIGADYTLKEQRRNCTITEMVFIDNKIVDGLYLLNIQLAPFELDASPSRPVLFELVNR